MCTISHVESLFRNLSKSSGFFRRSTLLYLWLPKRNVWRTSQCIEALGGQNPHGEEERTLLCVLALSLSNSVTLDKGETSLEFVFSSEKWA